MLIDDHLHHAASNHAARPFNSLMIYKLFFDIFDNELVVPCHSHQRRIVS